MDKLRLIAGIIMIAGSIAASGYVATAGAQQDFSQFKDAFSKPVDLDKRIAELADIKLAPNATTFNLDNGMQVVVISDHSSPVVTQMVWYRVGSADEDAGRSGLAHFFEHMMFRGTKDNPGNTFPRTVETSGGYLNAFTSYDYTAYHELTARQHLGEMMRLEADRMNNLTIDDKGFKNERQTVQEERRMRIDNNPEALFHEALMAAQFVNHRYGVPIIGWGHEIVSLSREDAIAFYRKHYRPDNAILVVAGDVSADEVLRLADENYGKIKGSGKPLPVRKRLAQEPEPVIAKKIVYESGKIGKRQLVRSYLVPGISNADLETMNGLQLLTDVLGADKTGMLYRKLVVEEKLADFVAASYLPRIDMTTLEVYVIPKAGTDMAKIEQKLNGVIRDIAANGVDPELLKIVKGASLGELIMLQDDTRSMANIFGRYMTLGMSFADIKNMPTLIAKANSDQLQKLVADYLVPKRSVTGYMLPKQTTKNKDDAKGAAKAN